MAERRPLIEGLNDAPPPPVDSARAKEFIYNANAAKPTAAVTPPSTTTQTKQVTRVHFTTRIRQDFVKAIKQASLKRQLEGIEPSTVQDILEQAIEPWLRDNGYLP